MSDVINYLQSIWEAYEVGGKGLIITTEKDEIVYINEKAIEWSGLGKGKKIYKELKENSVTINLSGEYIKIKRGNDKKGNLVYFISLKGSPAGTLLDSSRDYERLLDALYDDIFVTDADGIILRARGFSEIDWGLSAQKVIGKNVRALERNGDFYPSATVKTLKTKKKASVLQDTASGNKFVARSVPLLNNKGEIEKIIAVSEMITDEYILNSKLNGLSEIMALYKERLAEILYHADGNYRLVGNSQSTMRIRELIKKAASVDSTVLILGESGCGKEVVARNIHMLSSRRDEAFVKINCGAIPDQLLESELFGYERGAFTGADNQGKEGLIEKSNKGTLFLDEIGDMPLMLQVKLLEVLQDRVVKRIGSTKEIPINTRIMAATHQDLGKMIKEKKFRLDLFYRLNVLPIYIPPLRDRTEDILTLYKHFLGNYNILFHKNISLTPEAENKLLTHDWPGNVRQLANVIEKLVVLSEHVILSGEDVDDALDFSFSMLEVEKDNDSKSVLEIKKIVPWKEAEELLANQLFLKAYQKYKTTTATAEALQVNQSTVVRRLQKLKK